MEECVGGVLWGNLVVSVDNSQFGCILKGMRPEAEGIEETAEGPDVCLLVDGVVGVEVYHLGRAVIWGGVTVNLKR